MNRRLSLALAAVLSLVASLTSAQVSTTGTVTVVVEATDGSRLPGASVTIEAGNTTSKKSGVTNSQGEVTFLNLAPSPEYVVTTQLAGFNTAKNERILVSSGQTTAMRVGLAVASATEEVTVTADSPLVDTKSAIAGQDITLELTESLPTSRTYQGYLELVPGVSPSDPTAPGNPASKSGINYSDIRGDIGQSSRQRLLPRRHQRHRPGHRHLRRQHEHRGHPGAEGASPAASPPSSSARPASSRTWSPSRAATPGAARSTTSARATAWWATTSTSRTRPSAPTTTPPPSAARWSRTSCGPSAATAASTATSRSCRRTRKCSCATSTRKDKQWYGKGTWSPSNNDTLSFTFMNDPTNVSGRREATIPNSNDRARDPGRQPLQRALHPRLRRRRVRSRLRQAQRRGDRRIGDPRRPQHRGLPHHRRAHAGRPGPRRLGQRPHRPARHPHRPRQPAVEHGRAHLEGRRRVRDQRELPQLADDRRHQGDSTRRSTPVR